jgi:putative salt-induced outer membrane protein
MNTLMKFATVSVLALMVAAPAIAQSNLTGVSALNNQIDDITDDVNDDLTDGDDADRFGPTGVAQGWRGSFALSASGTSGNTDNGEVTGAGRLTYGIGDWSHLIGFAAEYGEANGQKNEEKFFATYEGSRYFTPSFYAFGVARLQYDGFLTDDANMEIDGSETDAFLGFGPGYRVLSKPNQTWRVQAGPGVRYVKDVTGNSDTEVGFIATSRYFYGINETVSFTMDTDILGSDANTVVANDAGVNFKLSNNLSTRISYRTEYNSDPVGAAKSTDNTFGVSLVLGF